MRKGRDLLEYGSQNYNRVLENPLLLFYSNTCLRLLFSDGSQEAEVTWARLGMLPYIWLCWAVIFFWSRSEHGTKGAVFAVIMAGFSPTFMAHARLTTSDALTSTFVISSAAALWLNLRRKTILTGVLFSFSLLLGFLSKYSFLLIPLLCFPVVLLWPAESMKERLQHFAGQFFLPLAAAIFMLNAAYGFDLTMKPQSSMALHSETLQGIARTFLGRIPAPFPQKYIQGMDVHLNFQGRWPAFIMGKVVEGGVPGYDVLAFFLKITPAAAVSILLILLGPLIGKPWGRAEKISLFFAVSWLTYFAFIHRVDAGVRYVLPAFPFVFFLCGRIPGMFEGKMRLSVCLTVFLSLVQFGVNVRQFPFYISYFNELAGGADKGHLWLGDSNISWCQELKALEKYRISHDIHEFIFGIESRIDVLNPYVRYRTIDHKRMYLPDRGDYVIWIASLQELLHQDPNQFLWCKLMEPDAVIADTAYIYHIREQITNPVEFMRRIAQRSLAPDFPFPWTRHYLRKTKGRFMVRVCLTKGPIKVAGSDAIFGVIADVSEYPAFRAVAITPADQAHSREIAAEFPDGALIFGEKTGEIINGASVIKWKSEIKPSRLLITGPGREAVGLKAGLVYKLL